MTAQYLVVRQPGANVQHVRKRPDGMTEVYAVGFVKPGQFFLAPHPDYEPSRFFRAMNAEAVEGLRKLKAKLEGYDKERAAALKDEDGKPLRDPDGRPIRPPSLASDVNLTLWEPVVTVPVVADSGLTASDLADMTSEKRTQVGVHLDGSRTAGKRTADR
jgi:hypothetical protein